MEKHVIFAFLPFKFTKSRIFILRYGENNLILHSVDDS